MSGVDPAILLATVGTILQTVAASTAAETTGVGKKPKKSRASGKSSSAAGQEAIVSSSTQLNTTVSTLTVYYTHVTLFTATANKIYGR